MRIWPIFAFFNSSFFASAFFSFAIFSFLKVFWFEYRKIRTRITPNTDTFTQCLNYNMLVGTSDVMRLRKCKNKYSSFVNPFSTKVPLQNPWKTSENRRFSDLFMVIYSGTFIENGLKICIFLSKQMAWQKGPEIWNTPFFKKKP